MCFNGTERKIPFSVPLIAFIVLEWTNAHFGKKRREDSTRVKSYLLDAYIDPWSEMSKPYGETPPTKW